MKFFTVFVTFCIGCCLAMLDQHQLEKMNGFTQACFEELHISAGSDFLPRLMQNKMTTFSDQQIDMIACMGRKYGVQNTEGKYNAQLVKEIFLSSNTFDRQQVEEVVDLCYGEPKGTSVKENVAEATKCFFANKKFKLM